MPRTSVFDARGNERDLGVQEFGHTRGGVQRVAQPHGAGGGLVDARHWAFAASR
jgi:hypothetical protein